MFTQLAHMADILLLSETRCGSLASANDWQQQFSKRGWLAYFSVSGTTHTGGTAVLFSRRAAAALRDLQVQPNSALAEGRLMMVTGKYKDEPVCFMAVYAPASRSERAAFLASLSQLDPPPGHLVIAGGDMNCTLGRCDVEGPDRHMAVGRQQLSDWVDRWSLQDAWGCAQHKDDSDLGWTKHTDAGHASRIDYVFVSRMHASSISAAATVPLGGSDHRAVMVKLGEKGVRGRWRLNAALLQQPHLCLVIAASLELCLEDVSEGRRSLGEAWIAFKEAAASHCREVAKAQKRKRNSAIRQARANVTAARTPEERAAAEACLQQQEAFVRQGELARMGVAAMQGDKPTGEFFRRMATPSTKADVTALTLTSEVVTTDQGVIMSEMVRYWKGVYGSNLPPEAPSPAREAAIQKALGRITAKLSVQQSSELEEEYTEEELLAALRSLPPGSSPGNDGLSVSFYMEFWPIVGGILTALLNAAAHGELLAPSILAARVIPFAKTKDAAPYASQFRPILLLGTDYKIMAKAVTRRLLKVMPTLCHPTQTGFIPGRSILHNVTSNRDCIAYHHGKPSSSVIAFLDFEKAFDRVSWHFRDRVLRQMGFPEQLLRTISVFYHDAPIQLELNGVLSVAFRATRGSRQGCPLSPPMFCLYAEPLGALLRDLSAGPAPTGIVAPPTRRVGSLRRLGGCLYADDTTVYCDCPASLERVIHALVDEFCEASGALLNIDKSSVLLLGVRHDAAVTHIAGIPVLRAEDRTSSLGVDFCGGDNPMPPRIPSIVASLDRTLSWWRQHCASLHSRARLANAMLSSRLWYHMQFEAVDSSNLHTAADTVWRCLWGTGENGKAKKGDVTRDRACAPLDMGGLGVIEPAVMHAALKARMVNLALGARGEWWTVFSEALVEHAAGTGAGTGFDGLASHHDRPDIAARCTGFWQQALKHWVELDFVAAKRTPSDQPWQAAAAVLLVQRALRTCPAEKRATMEAVARGGRQYLSDFYDFSQRRLVRPERVLTSSTAAQRRNEAVNHILDCATAPELATLSSYTAPPVGHLCRLRETPTLVTVLGPVPGAPGPPCGCPQPTWTLVRRLRNGYTVGPKVTSADASLWTAAYCTCRLSPFVQHPQTRRWLGEAASTGLLAWQLCNRPAELEQNSPVADLRAYFRERRQPGSASRPDCERQWQDAWPETETNPREWALTWRVVGSSNLRSSARTLVYKVMHRNLPLLSHRHLQRLYNRPSTCLLCNGAEETLVHLFSACSAVQRLWAPLQPLVAILGMHGSQLPLCRLAGLLGHVDVAGLVERLPAEAQAASTPKIRKVALQSWTEMRALVLEATWQARLDVFHGRAMSAAAALYTAERKVKAGLRYLLYLHLPYLSPWCLEATLEARQDRTLLQHVWSLLAPCIL